MCRVTMETEQWLSTSHNPKPAPTIMLHTAPTSSGWNIAYFSHYRTSSDSTQTPSASDQALVSTYVAEPDPIHHHTSTALHCCELGMAGNCYCTQDSLKKLLLQACENQNLEQVKACLTLNVDINYQAETGDIDVREGDTALHIAVFKGDFEVVKLLINHPRINVNLENKDGERPIVLLFRRKYFDTRILKSLIEVETLQLDFGSGSQHFTHLVCNFNPESLSILSQDSRFKINALNDEGDTPIAVAVTRKDMRMFTILFNHPEVDKSVLSPILVTAMEYASNNGYEMEDTTSGGEPGGFRKTRMTPLREVDLNNNNERIFRIICEHYYRMSVGRNTLGFGGRYYPIHIDFVEIIDNQYLELLFQKKQEEFTMKGIPNKVIFAYHGTKTASIDSILRNNFDLTKARRSQHGVGNYFSEYPHMAVEYSDTKNKIILCKLLPGRQYRGVDYDWPNYDSKLVNVSMNSRSPSQNNSSDMVIIKNNQQILPYCVIHLK